MASFRVCRPIHVSMCFISVHLLQLVLVEVNKYAGRANGPNSSSSPILESEDTNAKEKHVERTTCTNARSVPGFAKVPSCGCRNERTSPAETRSEGSG